MNWAKVGTGQLAQSVHPSLSTWRFATPFDLVPPRAIYSFHAKTHTSYHSSFTAEEQRSQRDTIPERRVMLVVYGFPSQHGNLARKTTSEFRSKDQDQGRIPVVILFM
jgi:hypothetical protein